jgi:iron complex outermembrane receptor protein
VDAAGKQLFRHYTIVNGVRTESGTTTTPSDADFGVIGNANPKFNLGLHGNGNWARVDLSFLVRAVGGNKVFNNTALVYATKGNALQGKNFLKSALTDGIGINEPAIFSSRYIEDGSFVRLQNVTVGYNFVMPGGGARSRTARVYLSGDNLLLHTKYTGYDPEVFTDAGLASRGVDYLTYPRARTFTSGLRVGL